MPLHLLKIEPNSIFFLLIIIICKQIIITIARPGIYSFFNLLNMNYFIYKKKNNN